MNNAQSLLNLDPKTTALIIIDLQKGITAIPAEPLTAARVIEHAGKLTEAFHKVKAQVILVHVTGAKDGKDMLHPNTDSPPIKRGGLPKDWADIVPELTPGENDLVITKHQWGAFYGTQLDLELRRRGIKTIVLSGISTNYGVESTARDAYERGYDLIFAQDAMAARTKADHEFAVTRIFPRIGRVRQTDQIITAWQRIK
jgi:nicotinamidase-related amidase